MLGEDARSDACDGEAEVDGPEDEREGVGPAIGRDDVSEKSLRRGTVHVAEQADEQRRRSDLPGPARESKHAECGR